MINSIVKQAKYDNFLTEVIQSNSKPLEHFEVLLPRRLIEIKRRVAMQCGFIY